MRIATALALVFVFGAASVAATIDIFKRFRNDVGAVQSTTDDQTILSKGINDKFFDHAFGTNGQACSTCHEPDQSFGLNVHFMRKQFINTVFQPQLDEIFRDNDTADRPGADESDPFARVVKYRLALELGTTRIARPLPPVCTAPVADPTQQTCRDFYVTLVGGTSEPTVSQQFGDIPNSNDPQSPGKMTLSCFRRPLVNTNVHFDSAVLWDGREDVTTMPTQAQKAAKSLLMATGTDPNFVNDAQEVADFMLRVFTDQVSVDGVGSLSSRGAAGGVQNLLALSKTYGPLICDPTNPSACPVTLGGPNMTMFDSWANLPDTPSNSGKRAVARGQEVFNTAVLHKPSDLNLPAFANIVNGEMRCTTCHGVPNVGNNPYAVFLGRLGTDSVPILTNLRDSRSDLRSLREFVTRLQQLPQYCFRSIYGPALSDVPCGQYTVGTATAPADVLSTDPGKALNGRPGSPRMSELGKFKPPVLRALAGREPYFHQGAAKDLDTLIDFYDARFNIHLTAQQHADLKAFLEAF